ncbi:hypothetical protein EMIHUDRAFT_240722 [Emiliania huxleyi CCMP1516]|uniref:Adenosylmethionine decarboxylase n=2 Tax=Emiliania huxleyi TaxID=2903 RepID=A0A0D3IVL3_EMIH1|nr:hypothetical protein EMIHUDRAFT_211444 [Emiliania huxleyi CCMP1516]XP_005774388.1 hypothetical protein EMIHUDRAFT_240722 [Emiliania huxleyi CCMP1516]EOD15298.1 hypothetical protein EMIHUDRAFT_211444 [Emiliania huxleyi CCMP1516]EOD21959.1 hypothetical protein EMIHUDRAFT_240722 [Emiliania huxleyi CCMP1516]|eukprot:XP_005767727.1 hypothetical protein EMIHUDRAFT_211444 [Emiliania huxleyi CCMP1516]
MAGAVAVLSVISLAPSASRITLNKRSALAAHGSHVVLDFEGFAVEPAAAGRWTLATLEAAAAAHGATVVHSKLVLLGEDGTTPPGFTAAVLLDESHATAHCYSEHGWLAVDVFTCGAQADTLGFADAVRRKVEGYVPGVRCTQHASIDRFLHRELELEDMRATADPTRLKSC